MRNSLLSMYTGHDPLYCVKRPARPRRKEQGAERSYFNLRGGDVGSWELDDIAHSGFHVLAANETSGSWRAIARGVDNEISGKRLREGAHGSAVPGRGNPMTFPSRPHCAQVPPGVVASTAARDQGGLGDVFERPHAWIPDQPLNAIERMPMDWMPFGHAVERSPAAILP